MVGFRVHGPHPAVPLPLLGDVWRVPGCDGGSGRVYLRVVGAMCQKLQAARYNSSYFDRGAKAGRRLCTPEGWFSCQVSHRRVPGATPARAW